MNNSFDFGRFCLTLKKDLIENRSRTLAVAMAMFGAMFFIYMAVSLSDYSKSEEFILKYNSNMAEFYNHLNKNYTVYAIWMLLISAPAYLSLMMAPMNSKKKRVNYLLLPASSLEKYISRLLLSIVGFLVVFFGSFFLVDLLRVLMCSSFFPTMDVRFIDLSKMIGDIDYSALFFNRDFFVVCLSYFVASLSMFILGATFWQKNAFLKSLVFFVVFTTGLVYFIIGMMRLFSEKADFKGNVFLHPSIIFSPSNMAVIVSICMLITIFNVVLAYYRFKESEIIQRW